MDLGSRLMSRINIVELSPHSRHCHSVFKDPFSLLENRASKPELKNFFDVHRHLVLYPNPKYE